MQPQPDTDLVVSTPERVSFDYQVAGLGTRAIAQVLDLLIVSGLLLAVYFVALAVSVAGSSVAVIVGLIGAFVVIFGYFWVSEALWSGQTIGKKAFRLRAVGDRGEPLTFAQAGIRNIVRIVDFLPYAYGVGLIVLFANGKGKRLGDLAAGTVVIHRDFVKARPRPRAAGATMAPPVALTPLEQRAILDFEERRHSWSEERAAELAEIATPLVKGLRGQEAVARVGAIAAGLVERR